MKTVKKVLLFLSKQAGYIVVMGILTIASMFVGILFAVTDSHPQDAGILTPMVTVPIAFVSGVLLCKLFNRKSKSQVSNTK